MIVKEVSENSPIDEVEKMTNTDLRKMCDKYGVPKKGGKYQMWDAIQKAKAAKKKPKKG